MHCPHPPCRQAPRQSSAAMAPCVRAEGWAALPRDVLGPMLCQVAEEAQAHGPLTLGAAEELLAVLSPCRHWRAVALEEVRVCNSPLTFCRK